MKRLLLAALALYLFIAPLTYHSDNKGVLRWVSRDYWKVWNIYDHSRTVFGEGLTFNYPPMNYVIAKLEWPLAQFIGGPGYYEWLNTNDEQAALSSSIYRYNLATKLPLLLAGIAVGWLIYQLALNFFNNKHRALLAAGLWLFNPIVVYSVAMMGQNDVLAILVFLAGWLVLHSNLAAAIVLFGLSISVKSYPIIWLVFLLITIKEWSNLKKVLTLIASYSVYLVTTLPFLKSIAFQEAVLKSTINERFFVPQINLGMDEVVYIIPILLSMVIIAAYKFVEQYDVHAGVSAWFVLLANLALVGFAHFHPQWFTWLIPFWAIWMASLTSIKDMVKNLIISISVFLLWLVVLILFKDKFLTWGIFSPLNQNLINMPVIYDSLLSKDVDVEKYVNLAHTGLAALAFTLIVLTITGNFSQIKHTIGAFALRLPTLHVPMFVYYLIPSLVLFLLLLGTNIIPAPLGFFPEENYRYIETPLKITHTFTAEHDNLSRIDFYASNPDLQSKDRFDFSLYDATGTYLYSLSFSGSNAGDPTPLRIDLPVIPNSKAQQYSFVIAKTVESDHPFKLGMNPLDLSAPVFKHFYRPDMSPLAILTRVINGFKAYVTQVPLVFVLTHLLIFFILNSSKANYTKKASSE